MTKNKITLLSLIGLLSGILTSAFSASSRQVNIGFGLAMLPGLIYGIALAVFFVIQGQRSIYKMLGLIAISTVAYYAAYLATIFISPFLFPASFSPAGNFGEYKPYCFFSRWCNRRIYFGIRYQAVLPN
jgi:hypothetical protein